MRAVISLCFELWFSKKGNGKPLARRIQARNDHQVPSFQTRSLGKTSCTIGQYGDNVLNALFSRTGPKPQSTRLTYKTRSMRRFRGLLCLVGLILPCIVIVACLNWAGNDSFERRRPLPTPPAVPEGATPQLLTSTPLPAAEWPIFGKPVIAADPDHRVVVVQNGCDDLSRLVVWRHGGANTSSDWQPLENRPAKTRGIFDPWMETDRRGGYFLVHTSLDDTMLVVRRSTDSGQTWSMSREVAKGADRPVMGISPSGKHLVIAASMVEARENAPKTILAYVQALGKAIYVRGSENWMQWKIPIQLSSESAEEVRMPAIAASGAMIHVSWMERQSGR